MLKKEIKDLLPDIIRDTMAALTQLTNAPDEMTLPITLAVANFATQGLTNVDTLEWDPCSISEYFVVLVPSGGMKTSISSMLMSGIEKFEIEEEQRNKQANIDYKIAMKKFAKDIDEAAKSSALVSPTEPIKPKGSRYRAEKATVNGLINTLTSVPFAGLFSSDAGEFFNSYSFGDRGRSNEMVSTLSKAWSGEALDRVTGIEENNVKLRKRRFNMLVLLQQELAGFLNDKTMQQQGFIHRLLVTQCELFEKHDADMSAAGRTKKATDRKILDPFNDRVYDLLTEVEVVQDKMRNPPIAIGGTMLQQLQARVALNTNPNELILPVMLTCQTDNATKLFEAAYNKYKRMAILKANEEFASFYNRAFEHVMRLAATLAAFDKKTEITEREAECAIRLIEYFIDQRLTLNVEGESRHDLIIEVGEILLKGLEKMPGKQATKTELFQFKGISRKITGEVHAKVLQDLVIRELIRLSERPGKGTKPIQVVEKV